LDTLAFWASTVIWISYSCLGREPNSFVFCFGSTKGNHDHSTFSREIRYSVDAGVRDTFQGMEITPLKCGAEMGT
jgi:hypothetical protein